jgi:hypothetical protein
VLWPRRLITVNTVFLYVKFCVIPTTQESVNVVYTICTSLHLSSRCYGSNACNTWPQFQQLSMLGFGCFSNYPTIVGCGYSIWIETLHDFNQSFRCSSPINSLRRVWIKEANWVWLDTSPIKDREYLRLLGCWRRLRGAGTAYGKERANYEVTAKCQP